VESRKTAPSDDGLFLSRGDEWVTETPRQNIGWVDRDRIRIPDPTTGAVAGTCLAWLRSNGVQLEPSLATVATLRGADAVFCLNSVRGITPVREIWDENDKRVVQIFSSANHPIVCRLQEQWRAALLSTVNR
jgi:branched-subunit amino acid aminotransferase/4-amino-4-deoxychorismate lyase